MLWQKRRGLPSSKVHFLSDSKSESALIKTGVCAFVGLILVTDKVNDVTINIYSNIEASGDARCCPNNMLVRGTSEIFILNYDPPIMTTTGVYVDISVAGGGLCSYQVLYDE